MLIDVAGVELLTTFTVAAAVDRRLPRFTVSVFDAWPVLIDVAGVELLTTFTVAVAIAGRLPESAAALVAWPVLNDARRRGTARDVHRDSGR